MKLALVGSTASPKLFSAIQLAYGLCGSYERIIVIGSSPKDTLYQHIGHYSTLFVPPDATPQRYMDLLNLVGPCGKEVIIFSTFSLEWKAVTKHLSGSYYEDVLRSHNTLMKVLRHAPRHVIVCIDEERNLIKMNTEGIPKIDLSKQMVQQPSIEKNFTTVLKIDKKGTASVIKDLTQTLPQFLHPTYQAGAMLQDWCRDGKPYVPEELQQKINDCNSLRELYQLLFDLDLDDIELISAFTKRRLELTADQPEFEVISGGQDEHC